MIPCIAQIGLLEIVLIVAAVVVLFGATQIPKIARSIGEGLKEFRKAVKNKEEGDEDGKTAEQGESDKDKKKKLKKK